MIVAGEASGDLHGATLARGLRAVAPACTLYGMGGRHMADAGVDLIEDVTAAAAVGGTEALGKLPRLYRVFRTLVATATTRRPDAVVLIDFPEFNLRLARKVRDAGVPVVYFIPPQIWAWRGGRIDAIRRRVSLVLAAFPFEAPIYRRAGVPCEFVGHPVLDALAAAPSRGDARRQLGLDDATPVVGLLPGSRREEVDRILPLMRASIERVVAVIPGARFALGLASTIDRVVVARALAGGPPVDLVPGGAHAVMRAADALIVASGTATLEAAVLGTPMVVVYRFSRLSEAMGRWLVRIPWISLANIVLGRAVVPELYQSTATVDNVTSETLRLLQDADAHRAQRDAFADLGRELGEPGVGERAARWVLAAAARR
ncbi:MAG: lipid-A-disaccharide synthase [Candidatus Rokubacteria bacterium]|nr:lipid-A-disaccharide synthase [Candidatus Rokubacteria bacterium]